MVHNRKSFNKIGLVHSSKKSGHTDIWIQAYGFMDIAEQEHLSRI